MAETSSLLNCRSSKGYRGFESPSLCLKARFHAGDGLFLKVRFWTTARAFVPLGLVTPIAPRFFYNLGSTTWDVRFFYSSRRALSASSRLGLRLVGFQRTDKSVR